MAGIQFTIGKNYIRNATLTGFVAGDDGTIRDAGGEEIHTASMPTIDSGMDDCAWGRFVADAVLSQNAVMYFYLAASNDREPESELCDPNVPIDRKKRIFKNMGGLRVINESDILLYSISGRYLWIMIEVIGENVSIGNIKVKAPGDNFMATFPEVYREKNSFFHRYLSVFSSIYNDFQEQIDHREELLDIKNASEDRLIIFAGWLGLEINRGYLPKETLRTLVKEAGELNRCKGTKHCIERLCQIMIGETPKIVERSLLERYVRSDDKEQIDRLYGENPYDVTLMFTRQIEEKKKKQLLFLLNQFKPIRSRLRIVSLDESGVLDGHTYLDQNAVTFVQGDGVLDGRQMLDGTIVLQ